MNNANGSQSSQIKAIMDGNYANLVTEQNEKRATGIIVGGVIGILLGTLTHQNAVVVGLIGATIGFITSVRKK